MAIVFGVNPGGKSSFAVTAIYYSNSLPASVIASRSFSGVDEARSDIVGTVGEWGAITTIAMDAPLTWSGSPSGVRACDKDIKKRLPAWAPKSWHRSPNSLPGSVSVQGPALTWALANEIKQGQLPQHNVVETNPRVSLALVAPELKDAILTVTGRAKPEAQREAVRTIVEHFVNAGIVRLETTMPQTPEELDAFVAALVALGMAAPETGLVVRELSGGEIRPVGARPLVLLEALP